MEKEKRQDALLTLVKDTTVANQQQIVNLMRQAGFSATQASISRDIRELGLVKLGGRYVPAEGILAAPAVEPADDPLSGLITKFEPVGSNLIVIHTAVGAASSVGVALDDKELDAIAGTVAGDDTLFVAVRSRSDQGRLLAMLSGWTGRGKTRKRLDVAGGET